MRAEAVDVLIESTPESESCVLALSGNFYTLIQDIRGCERHEKQAMGRSNQIERK